MTGIGKKKRGRYVKKHVHSVEPDEATATSYATFNNSQKEGKNTFKGEAQKELHKLLVGKR